MKYVLKTKSQTTNIIPESEFIQFMYHLESLVIELFEKHNELGPNILYYVKNSLLNNLHLNWMFIEVLKSSNRETNVELENEELKFIYERYVSIYMKSRQKTWRDINNYILEKGIANLRENLKAMYSSQTTDSTLINKKLTIMKKQICHPILPMLWNNFVYGYSSKKLKNHLQRSFWYQNYYG